MLPRDYALSKCLCIDFVSSFEIVSGQKLATIWAVRFETTDHILRVVSTRMSVINKKIIIRLKMGRSLPR